MAEPCKLSAMTLALRALVNNEELTRRLADIAEEGNSAALREGVADSVIDANEYSLKKESADIKFKAVLFGGVLANTRQGDEALDLLAQEIKNTHGTVAEGLNLVELISEMDLSGLEEAARVVFNTTTEEASKIVEEMRVKISNYIGSEYSVVTSGSSIKADKVIKSLDKEIDDAVAKLDKAKELLGEKTYNDVDKDLKRLKSQPKNNSKYWSTKEGRAETNKLADKYGKPHNKRILEHYLEDISEAKQIVSEQSDRLEILSKTYQDALNKDLKLIEAGQNPMEYVGADAEWKFIKGFDNSVSQRAKQYGQYALARTLLTDGGDIPQSVYDILVKTVKGTTGSGIENYLDEPLTEDWILSEDRTLDELLTRAYTNTKQLVSDGDLRTIYRQQLIALATDGELVKQDVEYIENLLNTMKLSEVGAGFSDVLKYNSLLQNAKDLGLDVGKYSGATLWREITDFLEEDAFDTLLKRGNTITLKKGLQMTHRELLELVSNMAGNLELKKAIATNQWTDNDLLRVAAKYLIGDVTDGAKRLKDLIGVAKENPVTDDIRGVILKAITGKNVPEKTKVAFFDFRKGLIAAEDVKFRAEYLDRLSDANKIEIPNATIPEITTTSIDGLIRELGGDEWKGGYLMVNDSQRKLNEVLEQALYNVNYGRKAEDRIQILYPKGGLMGQFRSEGGKLIFRTPYSNMFNEFLQTVALRTFGQAGGDSKFTEELINKLTKGDLDAISEVNKVLEEDARRYYGEMLGEDAYSERLIPMLEEATGISFKNYDSIVDKVAFWKRVDDRFMLEGKVLGKYIQDVVTVSDVLKDIDALTPESIAAELTQRFGYEIPVSQITENGIIKPDIKTAYTNYKLSQTPLELLERKGKLLAVINGGTADNITTNQFRSMIQSEDFSAYKEIFFHNIELSDEDLHKVYKQINDMIFDNLGAQVADNLVDMGYRLPLVNIRDLVYDWAKGTLDANNGFARAFLAKNNLDPTLSTLNSIIDEAIPNELKFSYDEGTSLKNIEQFYKRKYVNGVPIRGVSTGEEDMIGFLQELQSYDFKNRINIKQLAIEYGIPIEVMDDYLDVINKDALALTSVKYDEYGNVQSNAEGVLDILISAHKVLERGTLSHELFHGIINYVPQAQRDAAINGAMNLYGLSYKKANEMLADLFSEYYRTGKLILPREDYIKGVPGFKDIILKVFNTIKRWLQGVDKYEKGLRKLYEDIISLKYVGKEARENVFDIYGLSWADYYDRLSSSMRYMLPSPVKYATFNFDEAVEVAAKNKGLLIENYLHDGESQYDLINRMTNQSWFQGLYPSERDYLRARVCFLQSFEDMFEDASRKKISFEQVKKNALKRTKNFAFEGDPKEAIDRIMPEDVKVGTYGISFEDARQMLGEKPVDNVKATKKVVFDEDMVERFERQGLRYLKDISSDFFGGKVTMSFNDYMKFQEKHFKGLNTDYGDIMAEIFSKMDEDSFSNIATMDDIYRILDKEPGARINTRGDWASPGMGIGFLFKKKGGTVELKSLPFGTISNKGVIGSSTVPSYIDPATGIRYELSSKDYRQLFGKTKVMTELVPVKELDKLKDYDRRLEPKWSKEESDKTINELKESFQRDGVLEPLKIFYSVVNGKAYIAEGNHRLAAAKELGMQYLPANVYVLTRRELSNGVKIPGKPVPFGAGGYYPDFMSPSEIGIKGTISTPNPNMHFMERDDNLLFIEQPTEKEIDNYLSKNNVSDILLKKFGEAKSLDEGLFVTRDGKIISGRYRPDIFPVNEIWADAGYRLNLEHPTAIETAVFNLRKNVGKPDTYETASKMLLDRAMEKEGLIRIRPKILSDGNELIITIASKELSPQQKAVLSEYISKFKEDFREGTKGQIIVEAQRTDNKGMFPGETINVGLNTNINDIDKVLKEKINSQINRRIPDEEVFKNRAKQKENYGEGISLIKLGESGSSYMRRFGQYADQPDMPITDAMKVQMFTKDRTWQQIAEAYGFPTKIVQGDMIEGVKAYGAYGNGIIYFTDIVKESTPPHELFHAVFNTYVGKEQYDRILSDSSKLFQVSRRDAEELLANSFADWFKTGKFTYGDSLKAITSKNLTKEQKTFLQKVKDFFIDLAETLGLVDRHRAEVEQLFKDIVDVRVGIDTTVPDYIYRLSETTNEFMQDTYSSLVAMSAIRAGAKLPNAGHERQILQEMLNKYYQAFEDATAKGKTLSFKEAQDLKTRMGYALDMFEQNYLAPQYQRFLTPDEKNELFGLKYALGVTTNSDGLSTIREYNSKIMNRYTSATNRVLDRAELITSSLSKTTKSVNEEIEERQQELINQGATMKVVDGQPVVVDMRSELSKQLQNIPGNIIGLEQLKILGRSGLERLSNEEVFFLLNVVELAKNAENKMNLITKTIYKVSPQLAKVDFFNTFKAVDGLPKALHGNLLNGGEALAKYTNTDNFDKIVKEDIFGKIKNKFRENGQLSYDELSKIINDSIDTNIKLLSNTVKGDDLKVFKKEASMIYQGAFNLYTLLKDVPKGVKESIDEILNQQKEGIIAALNMLGDNNRLPEIMDAISIVTSDGTVKTFRQILDGEEANLSKTLFDEETNVIKAADEAAQETIDRSWKESKQKKVEAENRITVEKVNNNYRDGLQAYLNKMEVVSQAERDLINTTWTAAREIAKQYTLTNKLADTDNALASMNEAIMRDFKSGVLGFLGNITQGGQLVKWLGNIGDNIIDDVMKKWDLVRDRYRTLYSMSTEQLNKFEPKNIIDGLALNLVLYFKEIESRLGSIDGLTGGTTSRDINRAFAHLGEVVLNIDSVHALFSFMSGVEGNQILKFFRFANPQDAARVDEFIIGGLGQQYLGGYRNFVDATDRGFDREWFNKTFASNLSEMEYRKLIQALCGFTITSPKFRWLEQIFNFVNQSNYLFRVLMSYPGQLVTIHPQTIAYWLKQTGWERELQAEDLGAIDAVRKQTGILNTTYNEINWFRYASPDSKDPTMFFNRYGIPDVDDLMDKEKFYTSDDISSIYSKIDNYGSQGGIEARFNKFLRNTDAYKDNANNIIDGFFARNFKNIAFLKALQSNNYMKFATAEQFARFMASDAPEAMKKKLMEAVAESSGRNFRNILGLGFSGLDRAVGGSWERNIWIGLMQMFNFRGAWGQNIARQTWNWLSTSLYMAKNGLSKEGRDAMALYIAKQPEWTNFVTQLFNDLKYSRELVKFQDNGDWDPTDDDLSIIDFIQYAYETMQFSSQWRQGIQSYGTTRILGETIGSAIQTAVDPEIYKDTLGIGAFMNALSKNLGRNWKVPNLMVKTLGQDGRDEKWAYLGNEFWKLSFGTLRYLMNEDETSYGYSTELIRGRPGAIPFVISGETSEDGDKAFSYDLANTETWLNLVNWWEADDPEMARAYMMNNLDSFFNASQLFGIIKNIGRGVASSSLIGDKMKGWLADDLHVYKFGSPFDLAEIGDIVYDTEAGHDFIRYGQYRPTDARDVKILIDEVIGQANHRPGNDGFNKSMFDFDKSDHMASLESSNSADAFMELLLSNIKYERDDNFNFIVDDKGKKIETNYWKTHMADMMRHMNDNDYMTNSNYEFINTWVETNNDDPNYMLYRRLISEGLAGRYATQQINSLIDQHNKIHGYKGSEKLNLTKLKNSGIYDVVYPNLLGQETLITGEKTDFLTAIMQLDKAATQSANIKMIERQLAERGDNETIQKLFNINKKGEISLGTKYESYLKEQAKLSQALNEGDVDKFIAETSGITRMFRDEDPYGLMTTTLIASRISRINNADTLSVEQKAKAIDALFTDNYDFIQTHIPQLIETIGNKDLASDYVAQMNNSLYDISYIGDKLIADSEMANSKSGRSSAVNISTKAKDLLGSLGKSTGNGDGVGGGKKYDYNITPVKLDGAKLLKMTGAKGYTPQSSSEAIQAYKAHADFSLKKDINREVKGPKTQTISSKKQLSNLEKKTTKALEAES